MSTATQVVQQKKAPVGRPGWTAKWYQEQTNARCNPEAAGKTGTKADKAEFPKNCIKESV